MADLAKIVEDLSALTVLEAAELSKLLEEKWGVSAAAPVAMAMPAGGADVVFDIMGAKYLDRNIDALAPGGRLVIIGMQGGIKAELNIAKLLGKRAGVLATALRSRPVDGPDGKGAIVAQVAENVWPMVAAGRVRPLIGAELPVQDAAKAHALLSSGDVAGKVLLNVSDDS